jgi:hypothetical protein
VVQLVVVPVAAVALEDEAEDEAALSVAGGVAGALAVREELEGPVAVAYRVGVDLVEAEAADVAGVGLEDHDAHHYIQSSLRASI